MSLDKIIKKITILLNITTGNGASPNEAEMAAKRAQTLIIKHKIQQHVLNKEKAVKIVSKVIFSSGRIDRWKLNLLGKIADVNNCQYFYTSGISATCYGHENNVAIVKYLYIWLEQQITGWATIEAMGLGKIYSNSYKDGMVFRLGQRLQEAKKQAHDDMTDRDKVIKNALENGESVNEAISSMEKVEYAIAVIDKEKEEVNIWKKRNLRLRRGSSSKARFNANGFNSGKARGSSVNLSSNKTLS
tara:strand:+ start:242 stop:976 length:735 start_codon:yes stop_codon:yes gene_type:complete